MSTVPTTPRTGLRIGKLFGIELRLDFGVLLIFALIVYSLATGVFPKWHPDWSLSLVLGTSLGAGLLFFAALLSHELAHSVVAKLHGIRVPRITLFLFGGVSELEHEPDSPRVELLIAIVGPLVSILLGVFFLALGFLLAPHNLAQALVANPEAAVATLGPVATMSLWLGPVNLFLGVFNLVPGFPLDGGRVLRAILWAMTHSLDKATLWASNAGRAVAWSLMGLGALQALSGGLMQGIWLAMIGWFLNGAARNSYLQMRIRTALRGLSAGDLMRTHFETVTPDANLETFVTEHMLRSGQTAWPVIGRSGELLGIATFESVAHVPPAKRRALTVEAVMHPVEPATPQTPGPRALEMLSKPGADPTPVVEDGHTVGLLYLGDLAHWLTVHQPQPA